MRVTSIDIRAVNTSNVCSLSFRDPTSQNPYQVSGIVGLDAEEIVPRYYGASGGSDDKYYTLSLQKRDVVVKIVLNPRFALLESYSSLRDELYRLIASARTGALRLEFKDGVTVVASVSGFVSKFETDQFAKQPSATLTISCDEPMLRGPSIIEVDVGELDPEYPVIEDELSTAPHGFVFDVTFTSDMDDFIIADSELNWAFGLAFGLYGGFHVGDVLHFSSEHNAKELYLTRSAAPGAPPGAPQIHLAHVVSPRSIWPIIFPGTNSFVCSTGFEWTSMSYYPTYWGV